MNLVLRRKFFQYLFSVVTLIMILLINHICVNIIEIFVKKVI